MIEASSDGPASLNRTAALAEETNLASLTATCENPSTSRAASAPNSTEASASARRLCPDTAIPGPRSALIRSPENRALAPSLIITATCVEPRSVVRSKLGELPSFTARGHALELRLTAEDPERKFMPSPGTVTDVRWPARPWVRVDTWLEPGVEVPPFYDSLLAKLIVWGASRDECVARARRAYERQALLRAARV